MKYRVGEILAYGIPSFIMVAVLAFNIFRPVQVIPRLKVGPGFGLTDIQGQLITNETLRGKIVLYNFTYTHCGVSCDTLMTKMRQVQQRLVEVQHNNIPIEFVTISIDPERDTPEIWTAYAHRYNMTNTLSWYFLRQPDEAKLKITLGQGFAFYYEKINSDTLAYDFKFQPMIVMIDGGGIVRAEYRQFESDSINLDIKQADIDPDIILRDLNLVVTEARNSNGLAKGVYEAAHLFSCYPP